MTFLYQLIDKSLNDVLFLSRFWCLPFIDKTNEAKHHLRNLNMETLSLDRQCLGDVQNANASKYVINLNNKRLDSCGL